MGRTRLAALVSATAVVLSLAVYLSQRPVGFATPSACLDAYREASLVGDLDKYRSCLTASLYADILRRRLNPADLAGSLCQEMKDVKGWIQVPEPTRDEALVQINVD